MSSTSKWIIETTDETFEQDVIERSKEVPVVVDFWAEWCAPCDMLAPMLENLVMDFAGRFVLVKANTEQMPIIAGQFHIQSIPAVYGFREGEVYDYFMGVQPEHQLRLWLERLLPTVAEQHVAEAGKLAQTDPLTAEQEYRAALQLDPDLATAKIELAALLLPQGRFDECRELLEELERRGFLEPVAARIKAKLQLESQAQDVGSVAECRAAVEEDPDAPNLKLRLAEALSAVGQYEEALETSLQLIRDHKQEYGESARKIMVDIFQLLPDDSELTGTFRRMLASALY